MVDMMDLFIEALKRQADFLKKISDGMKDFDVTDALTDYAAAYSKTVEELSEDEKKQAWLDAVLEQKSKRQEVVGEEAVNVEVFVEKKAAA